ncbi:hypothetical protein [Bradyrhizobium sp. sGM-13]|uniref:hypothetical protein n=1 Tax=Bradyrhizobium sp. sGM-13 TaxID=2831781 RepID=UPI001BCDC44C|nr:hypothetical protein [Bradyrhizobium sp. sGM-13]
MSGKAQTAWALVFSNGHIHHGRMSFTRKQVIEGVIAEYRGFHSARERFGHMTDVQLWRHIKRKRGYSVRRVSLRVVRS